MKKSVIYTRAAGLRRSLALSQRELRPQQPHGGAWLPEPEDRPRNGPPVRAGAPARLSRRAGRAAADRFRAASEIRTYHALSERPEGRS